MSFIHEVDVSCETDQLPGDTQGPTHTFVIRIPNMIKDPEPHAYRKCAAVDHCLNCCVKYIADYFMYDLWPFYEAVIDGNTVKLKAIEDNTIGY